MYKAIMINSETLEKAFREYIKGCVLSRRPVNKTDFIIGGSAAESYISFVKPDKLFSYNPAKWAHVKNIFDIKSSEKILEIIKELFTDDEFNKVDNEGTSQYFRSNAIKQYYCFLKALEVFNAYSQGEYIAQEKRDITSLQQIYYGAPGTGKSHTINELTEGESVIRTTFHPDSDYSTFVGAYKPTMGLLPICDELGQPMKIDSTVLHKEQIIYEFADQAFLQAYVQAWKFYAENSDVAKKQYLIIEEINRGNCAQIFGDLFLLLDRNDNGFSVYPINADKDMKKQLAKAFKKDGVTLAIPNADKINALYKGKDIVSKVLSGEILVLPNNLYIWATMNTSDQSLFPIDSAFKRRWEWQYMPIGKGYDENGQEIKWAIEGATQKYDWWSFLEKINAQIGEATQSEDKKLGFFFCKATDGVISAEKFVGKVISYLWNDVFKNNGFEGPIFKDVDGTELSFAKFYKSDMKGNAIVQKDKVEMFLTNLGVEIVEEVSDEDYEEDEVYEDDGARVSDTNAPYRVTFPDGEIICEGSGWETYVASLQKIGLEKALPFGEMYSRLNKTLPLITKNKIADQGVYKYYEVDGYYILSGTDSQHRLLKRMNKDLNLGLTIE